MQNQLLDSAMASDVKTEYINTMRNNIPLELQQIPHWVCFKLKWCDKKKKYKKVPHSVNGYKVAIRNDNINKFGKFEDTLKTYFYHEKNLDGIGFVFTNTNNLIGIDIDNCIQEGKINGFHKELIMRLKSYNEYRPSGTGFHVIIKGKLDPSWSNRANDKSNGIGYEIYEQERFFTFTGNLVKGEYKDIKTVESIHLNGVYEKYFNAFKTLKTNNQSNVIDVTKVIKNDLKTNISFLELGLKKDKKFKALYNAERSSGDESANDFALCCKLAHWSNHDSNLMMEYLIQGPYFNSKGHEHQAK